MYIYYENNTTILQIARNDVISICNKCNKFYYVTTVTL